MRRRDCPDLSHARFDFSGQKIFHVGVRAAGENPFSLRGVFQLKEKITAATWKIPPPFVRRNRVGSRAAPRVSRPVIAGARLASRRCDAPARERSFDFIYYPARKKLRRTWTDNGSQKRGAHR